MTSYHSGLEIQLRRAGDSKLSKRTQGGGSESSVLSQTYTSGHLPPLATATSVPVTTAVKKLPLNLAAENHPFYYPH